MCSVHSLVPAFLFICTLASQAWCQPPPVSWATTPFSPAALPLAVRSPYLNTWLSQGFGPTQLNVHTWPNFWPINGTVTSWYASAVVDGTAYRLLGVAPIANVSIANQTAVEFTATRTSVQLIAGPMQMNLSFISPIEPLDLIRQSLPFTYLSISATSTDGKPHSLQMYSDISGEFITGDTSRIAEWSADEDGDYIVLSMRLQMQQSFTEINSFAQDATAYYSLKKIGGTTTTWAIADDQTNRGNAANESLSLGNQSDSTPRAVSTFGNNQPVLGIGVDWGSIQETSEPGVWALGVVRSPSIQYKTSSGQVEERYPYFLSYYDDVPSAAKALLDDFARAEAVAASFDAQLAEAGEEISETYASLLHVNARQAMGCMDITLSKSDSGDWNMSDIKVFMKNMGGAGSDSGTTMSVNTVDTLYAAFPMFMYLNPELGGYLLSPLLEYQDSDTYGLGYAAKNIGSSYPNATADGLVDGHAYGLEESANMLIMILAYSQASGNGTYLNRHYNLLRRWATYLVDNSLTPTNQRSPDFSTFLPISTNNQTNTALKGIIGIAAMAKISGYMDNSDDQKKFNETAISFINEWQNKVMASDHSHINFFYNTPASNGLIYNVYADKMLHLGLVPDTVYEALTVFYDAMQDQNKFGIPLSSSLPHNTSTSWMIFAASTVTSPTTRDEMISKLQDYATSNNLMAGNFYPMITNYDPATGGIINANGNGANSPTSGAVFAILALNTTVKHIAFPSGGNNGTGTPIPMPKTHKSKLGTIIGGAVGGAVVAGSACIFVFLWRRKRRESRKDDARIDPMNVPAPITSVLSSTSRFGISSEKKAPPQPPIHSSGIMAAGTRKHTARPTNEYSDNIRRMALVRKPENPAQASRQNRAPTFDATREIALEGERNGNGEGRRNSTVLGLSRSDDLREEIDNLRREVERMRENIDGTPPSYYTAENA